MRRHNQRIYRIVRGILRDDGEAEDVMQDAYVRAYQHLEQFEGRSSFVTWLTRIAMHEAFARASGKASRQAWTPMRHLSNHYYGVSFKRRLRPNKRPPTRNWVPRWKPPSCRYPEIPLGDHDARRGGDEHGRSRSALEISEDAVKVRLHRARALMRRALYRQSGQCARELFTFPPRGATAWLRPGPHLRCAKLVA